MRRVWLWLLGLGVAHGMELFNPVLSAYWLPFRLEPQAPGLGLSLYAASHLNYLEGSWGRMGFDLEEWGVVLGVRVGQEPWSLGVFLPLALYWGGVMDPTLDALHGLLGLPRNQTRAQTLLFLSPAQGEGRTWEGPTWGPKDLVVRLDYQEEGLLGFVALGLPTGSVERFLGSGGYRLLLGGGWALAEGEVRLGLLWPLGDAPLFLGLGPRPSLGLEARWRRALNTPLDLEVQLLTSPLSVGPPVYGALRVYLGGVGFAEGLPLFVPDGMPDVVFSWAGAWPLEPRR
jgi:hypothetical protein